MTEEIIHLESRVIACSHCGTKTFEIHVSNGVTGKNRIVTFICKNDHKIVMNSDPFKMVDYEQANG